MATRTDSRVRTLSTRELNRAMLARQLLLRRSSMSIVDAVEQVFGLNAQDPNVPYLALHARLETFGIAELTGTIERGELVRSVLMRGTQHLVSAADFQLCQPLHAPLLRRIQRGAFGARTAGVDLDRLVAEARALLADGAVLTRPELGRALAGHWPDAEPSALGWTAQYLLPVTHPAPSGTWNVRGATPFRLTATTPATFEDAETLVRRYLAAFGPATTSDARAWCGVSGLREVFARLRPELVVYRDPAGREVFDLPDAPRPDGDLPAPVRLLPEFDATLLCYADRSRTMTDEVRAQVCVGDAIAASVLVDGTVAATWTRNRTTDVARLSVHPLRRLPAADRAAIEADAHRLLTFTDPDATHHAVELVHS